MRNEVSEGQSGQEQREGRRSPRSLAEWVSFGLASLVLGTVVGLVIYSGVTQGDRPPVIRVERVESTREADGQFYVPFEIVNTGGETAESVQVIAELRKDGEVEQVGDLQIDFLAGGETEKGAFVLNQKPQTGELLLRVGSYKVP